MTTQHWLLAGADGSLHVLGVDGTPLDHFNCGAALTGICVTQHGERPMLLLATTDGLTAWTVERKSQGATSVTRRRRFTSEAESDRR
jgi:hypothetical protein